MRTRDRNLSRALQSVSRLCEANRDGSFATQAKRRKDLALFVRRLHGVGRPIASIAGMKTGDIEIFLDDMRARGVSVGRQKNVMAALRWAENKTGRWGTVPRTNDKLSIPNRERREIQRAWTPDERIDSLPDVRMRLAVRLMSAFGLRFKEALLLRPQEDWQGRSLHVARGSKGGRPRVVPVERDAQRRLLAEAAEFVGGGSLVPPELTYIKFRKAMEYRLLKAGIGNVHGLRHAYAQALFERHAGFPCPRCGGPRMSRGMARRIPREDAVLRLHYAELLRRDRAARRAVMAQLGHGKGRFDVVREYLG